MTVVVMGFLQNTEAMGGSQALAVVFALFLFLSAHPCDQAVHASFVWGDVELSLFIGNHFGFHQTVFGLIDQNRFIFQSRLILYHQLEGNFMVDGVFWAGSRQQADRKAWNVIHLGFVVMSHRNAGGRILAIVQNLIGVWILPGCLSCSDRRHIGHSSCHSG